MVMVVAVIPGAEAVGPVAVVLPHPVTSNTRPLLKARARIQCDGPETVWIDAIFETPPPEIAKAAASYTRSLFAGWRDPGGSLARGAAQVPADEAQTALDTVGEREHRHHEGRAVKCQRQVVFDRTGEVQGVVQAAG